MTVKDQLPDVKALWNTPIATQIDLLQDDNENAYIIGFSADGKYALIRISGYLTIASVDTVNGHGRWECNYEHFQHHSGLYYERFPLR